MSFRSRFGTGFPFDDTEDRGLRTRQHLDDLAQRHPEFAEHLNPDSWGRTRTSSASGASDPFARFRNRARFQDFGFPFDDFDDPRQFERFYQNQDPTQQHQPQSAPQQKPPQPNQPQQNPQQPTQAQAQQSQTPQGTQVPVSSKPPTAPDSSKKIQQSNTVDLGQPQAPLVDETRTHRSMSAPPEHPNRAGGKRNVYSGNTSNVNADMGNAPTTQQHPDQTHNNPKERIIPIHVEGRDEVLTPSAAQANQTHSQDDLRHQEELRRQQQQQRYQEYMRQQQHHQQQQGHGQQQQQQHQQQYQQQHQEVPPPQQPKLKPTSLELIQNIQKDVSDLMTQVETFDGKPRDKKYLYLDEMLTRKMLQLDDIETGGQDSIRKARKEAIKCIQDTIKELEMKAQANEDANKTPAKEATPTPAPTTKAEDTMDVTPVASADASAAPAAHSTTPDSTTAAKPTTDPVPQPEAESNPPTKEKTPENQELVVGGVARSGSQVTQMDVDPAPTADPSQAQPAPPAEDQPKNEEAKEDATEKKRAKKKAEKK